MFREILFSRECLAQNEVKHLLEMQLHQIIGQALSREAMKTSKENNGLIYSSAIMGRGLTPNSEFNNNLP